MPLYGDILGANFCDLENSLNRQINGDLEPLKGLGIHFFGLYYPLIYLNISSKMIKQGETIRNSHKIFLNSWQGLAQLSPPSPSPPPSEFCTDEDNSVFRSAMDAWRYLKKK
jgi:hypothetical protein